MAGIQVLTEWLNERQARTIWRVHDQTYELYTTHGKPMDIVSLKSDMSRDAQGIIAAKDRQMADLLATHPPRELEKCPICEDRSWHPVFQTVRACTYRQCIACSHVYLSPGWGSDVVESFFREDKSYRNIYTDPEKSRLRIEQIALPKLQWTLDMYRTQFGRLPSDLLDVGAGAGHFLAACDRMSIAAEGVEISSEGVRFGVAHLGVRMTDGPLDILPPERRFDVVTLWGVLECVPDVEGLLRQGVARMRSEGMLAIEVPRWDSLSSDLQKRHPDRVLRHLDPIGHPHCFGELSMLRLLQRCHLRPIAAWYFGMDAWEAALHAGWEGIAARDAVANLGEFLQTLCDRNQRSDEFVVVAVRDDTR